MMEIPFICPQGMQHNAAMILGLRPANERHRYKVTPSLIGWEQTSNHPWNVAKGSRGTQQGHNKQTQVIHF